MCENPFFVALRQIIDKHRRDVCQQVKQHNNPAVHMYYEGQRVALTHVQHVIDDILKERTQDDEANS